MHRLALDWQPRRDESDDGQPRADAADGWVQREDRGELSKPVRLDDGSMLYSGYASRAGVYTYRDASGRTWRELVTAETLARTAHTLSGAPVTVDHPKEDVTAGNIEKYGVGKVDGRAYVDQQGRTNVRVLVTDRRGIEAVEKGRRELSQGYRAKLDHTPGNHPEFGPYDVEQVDRLNNHLAIVENGRHGFECGLRADAAEFVSRTDGTNTPAPTGRPPMKALIALLARLGGDPRRVDSTNEDALADAIGEAVAARIDEADARTDAMKAERDQAAARADGAEARLKLAKEQEAARKDAADRDALAEMAASHKVDAKAHTTAPALRRAIAIAARPKLFEGVERSDAYVETLIEVIRDESLSTPAPRNDAGPAWRKPAPDTRTDAGNQPRTRPGQTATSLKAFGPRQPAARGE